MVEAAPGDLPPLDERTFWEDEPLLSPLRILYALRWWAWFTIVTDGDHNIGIWHMVRFYHRPYAARRRY